MYRNSINRSLRIEHPSGCRMRPSNAFDSSYVANHIRGAAQSCSNNTSFKLHLLRLSLYLLQNPFDCCPACARPTCLLSARLNRFSMNKLHVSFSAPQMSAAAAMTMSVALVALTNSPCCPPETSTSVETMPASDFSAPGYVSQGGEYSWSSESLTHRRMRLVPHLHHAPPHLLSRTCVPASTPAVAGMECLHVQRHMWHCLYDGLLAVAVHALHGRELPGEQHETRGEDPREREGSREQTTAAGSRRARGACSHTAFSGCPRGAGPSARMGGMAFCGAVAVQSVLWLHLDCGSW
ncbi:hypothetical protein B0H10DRAFT_1186432 [Mycena sp. CBHHK59/15]|nr:hypothetical protein B0H10DRAFT_1186432 [Mycena sp. CBHHK59/15]